MRLAWWIVLAFERFEPDRKETLHCQSQQYEEEDLYSGENVGWQSGKGKSKVDRKLCRAPNQLNDACNGC